MLSLSDWSAIGATAFVIDWLLKVVFLFYVPRNRKPSSAMAWLLAIYLLPFIGVALFLLIGSPKLSRRRRALQQDINQMISNSALSEGDTDTLTPADAARYEPLIHQATELGKMPARQGNTVTITDDYQKIIDAMIADIHAATQCIYIQSYALALDSTTQPLFDAIETAVTRGVPVYVLFDTIGSRPYKGYRHMKRELTRIGARWQPILPIRLMPGSYSRPDLRNHRKITAIDNSIAYIGSLNLLHRRYQRKDDIIYDELTSRIQGPAARQAAAIFAGDWMSEAGTPPSYALAKPGKATPKKSGALVQLLPSGPSYEYANNLHLFTALFYSAKKSIVITNPYFVPDEALLHAVINAAKRGVAVTIINSEAQDQWMVGHAQRSYYLELLRAGVTICLYKAPHLLHSKHLTIDDDIAVIGSSNMDIRSFELNLECVAVAYDKPTVATLRAIQTKNIAASKRVTLEKWSKRSVFKNLLDSLTRLTSSLQ